MKLKTFYAAVSLLAALALWVLAQLPEFFCTVWHDLKWAAGQ
jgi:hypothetical protein